MKPPQPGSVVCSGLHIEALGAGADLILLHGWGMHSGIWRELAIQLSQGWRVHLVDLPGHGRSRDGAYDFDLPQLAAQVRVALEPGLQGPAVWLGWSLGGMLALQVALQQPALCHSLVLLASTPRFSQAEDWPHAMAESVLEQFAAQLLSDQRSTLQRFLALQVMAAQTAPGTLRCLRETVFGAPLAETAALHSGLRILREADLRGSLHVLDLPVLLLAGERDQLVPLPAMQASAALLPRARLAVARGAGHAPFISHPSWVLQQLHEFTHGTD